jgi:arylsulfatase A-like enzyme
MTAKMTRRRAGGLLARLGGGAAAARALGPATGPWILSSCSRGRERPNILFIFSDDHAGQAIGACGSRINRTPNIDRLASGGAIFRNSFCTNGICAPSRAVVLTGKHSHRNGKIDNSGAFDMSQPTFNKMLQASGYQTALIGKWHLQADPAGFDHWAVLPGQGHYYNPDFLTPAGPQRHEGYVTKIITDRALDWLEGSREKGRPFLLMCQHKAPHRNWMPAPDKLDLYEGEDIPEPETLFDDGQGRASPFQHQEMTVARHLQPAYDLKITPPEWRDSIYYHYYEYPAVHMVARHYGVRTGRWKLIHYYETGEWELFDLERDPHELCSLHADPGHADLRRELEVELHRLRSFYGDDTGRDF